MKNEKEIYESNDRVHACRYVVIPWKATVAVALAYSIDRSVDRTYVHKPEHWADKYCKTRPSFANAWIMDTRLISEEALAWVRSIHPLGSGDGRGRGREAGGEIERKREGKRIRGTWNYLSTRRSKLNKRRIFRRAYPPHWRCVVAIPRSMNHHYRGFWSVMVTARCFFMKKKLISSANITRLIASHINNFLW